MFVMHTFKFSYNSQEHEGPVMGTMDVEWLRKLFPTNPVWNCERGLVENQMYPKPEEAKALYEAMARHYCFNEVSDSEYITGGTSIRVVSNLRSVFDEHLNFFRKVFGDLPAFTPIIQRKHDGYKKEKDVKRVKFRNEFLSIFEKYPDLMIPPDKEIREALQNKLSTYIQRREKCFQHPDLAYQVDQAYRTNKHKIELLETLLKLNEGESLNLKDWAQKNLEENSLLDAQSFWFACGVVAHYTGKPFPDCPIASKLIPVVTA
jgi:hypothetical protein